MTFVTLIFGFCAFLTELGQQHVVEIGYVSQGQCIGHILVGDSHGETLTWGGHTFGVSLIEGGAEVAVDGQRFVLLSTDPA